MEDYNKSIKLAWLIDCFNGREMEKKRGRFVHLEQLLPPEITAEILSRLPADSTIGCRCICKQWRSLIDDPCFVDTHTSQLMSSSSSSSNPKKFGNCLIPNSSSSSYGFFLYAQQDRNGFQFEFIEYNDDGGSFLEFKPSTSITNHVFPFYHDNCSTPMITSCNGLVFMGPTTKPNDMFVCNPFTREYVNLRTPASTKEEEGGGRRRERKGYMACGFGYHHSINEYKVVSIYYDNVKKNNGKVSVYTLGSGKWRNKGEIQYWLYSQSRPGFLANGAIHWFTYNYEIVSFDLVDEEFKVVVVPLLPSPATSTNYADQYGVLGGCLCVTRNDRTGCESPKDIWVLNVLITNHINNNEEEEDEFSWNKKFSIPWKGSTSKATPLLVLKSGKIVLRGGGTGLVSYDPKTEAFNGNIFPCDYKAKIIPYTKSFVSLKALGEEDAKCWGFAAHNQRPLHSGSSSSS